MNELVTVHDNYLSTYDEVERAAKAMAASGFFTDTKQASQAIVKILAARELGLGPFAGMNGVNIIQGKPAFSANIMAACVKKSGRYNYRVTEMTDKNCTIEFMEYMAGKWNTSGVSSFTIEDAKKAGTKNLDKFPRNMLFARAMSNGVRWYCPDVMSGSVAYTPEELGADVDEDGNVIAVEVVEDHSYVIEPEPEPVEETLPMAYTMTIEDACKTTTSKGVAYGKMDIVGLEKMLSAMHTKLAKNELSPEERAEVERKIKAAQMVRTAKVNKEI